MRHALADEPLIVHGDGSQTRSFTWVGDVVAGLLALIAEPRSVGQVFNIGNGAEVSIRDLATKIIGMTGSDSTLQFVPYHHVFGHNFEDMARRVPDISEIQSLVGYRPTVHIDEILARVVDYWTPERATIASAVHLPVQLPQLAAV